MTQIEAKKANVLTYLRTAMEQLGEAQNMLAPKTELWNQIHKLDSEVDDIISEIEDEGFEDEGFEDDFRIKRS